MKMTIKVGKKFEFSINVDKAAILAILMLLC